MNNLELTKECLECVEKSDFKRVEELLDEKFTFSGPMPTPQNREEFLKTHRALLGGLSDFKYNVSDLKEVGNTVTGTVQIEAKHTGKLDLSFMDGPVVEATNKSFSMPKEPFMATIVNGKATQIVSAPVEGGGLTGILKEVGAEMPKEQPTY